jgi:hypothetical protein
MVKPAADIRCGAGPAWQRRGRAGGYPPIPRTYLPGTSPDLRSRAGPRTWRVPRMA